MGGRSGGGVKSYDSEKACYSINHSIFSSWERCGEKNSLGILGESKKGHEEEGGEPWIGRIRLRQWMDWGRQWIGG